MPYTERCVSDSTVKGNFLMFFDTHAHYDDKAFDADRDELLNKLFDNGTDFIVNPGCSITSTRSAMDLSEKFTGFYFASGIHPEEIDGLPDDWLDQIEYMSGHKKCVAIGEIGLDYYWVSDNKEEQKAVFSKQLSLASKLSLPVIIHDREAHGDCLEAVKNFPELTGVFHCYSGSAETAAELIKLGWYIGFDGPITYKNAKKAVEAVKICPMDRLLIETDSPYLSPQAVRGTRNDSQNLIYIAARIAEIKGCSIEDIAAATAENAIRLFNIQ